MDEKLIKRANKHMDKCKVHFMKEKSFTFYMVILFQMKLEWTDDVDMIATDGFTLFIRPKYWTERSIPGCIDDLLHETMHLVLNHIPRIRKYKKVNKTKYNYAADIVLNNILIDSGRNLDKTFVIDRKMKGKSAEEVYNLLPEPPKNFKPDIKEGKPIDEGKLDEHIKRIVSNAKTQATVSKQWSNVHSTVKRIVEELLDPVLNWQEILIDYMTAHAKEDYSWTKRNRRNEEFYLPSLYSEGIEPVNVYPDCSGSITPKMYTEILSEIAGIIDILQPPHTKIVNWGSALTNKVIKVEPDEELLDKAALENLGGTNLTPVIQHINETMPEVAVIYSDGYFAKPSIMPTSDTIFIIWDNPKFTTKMGKVIHYVRET